MLHVGMNIADKARLFREVRRVLRPGARFGIYDVLQGPGGAPLFPVPWATGPQTSFLVTADALQALLRGRSEEHTSELQSLMRTSNAGFCLTKTKHKDEHKTK